MKEHARDPQLRSCELFRAQTDRNGRMQRREQVLLDLWLDRVERGSISGVLSITRNTQTETSVTFYGKFKDEQQIQEEESFVNWQRTRLERAIRRWEADGAKKLDKKKFNQRYLDED